MGKYPFYNSEAKKSSWIYRWILFWLWQIYHSNKRWGQGGQWKYGDQIGLGKVFGKSGATSHQYALYMHYICIIYEWYMNDIWMIYEWYMNDICVSQSLKGIFWQI